MALIISHDLCIYYLPGHGGRINNGLGQALVAKGYEVLGRETVGDFKKLNFNEQVSTIANDLKEHFWHEDGLHGSNSENSIHFGLRCDFCARVVREFKSHKRKESLRLMFYKF